METLLTIALTNGAAALALAVFAMAADRWMRIPTVAHFLWTVVLVRLLMPPLVNVPLLPSSDRSHGTTSIENAGTAFQQLPTPAVHQWWSELIPNIEVTLIAAWALGAVALGTLTLVRIRRFHQDLIAASSADSSVQDLVDAMAKQMAVPRAPQVLIVEAPISPMVWAPLRRSCIVLPAELLRKLEHPELETLIAHELAHISRGDHRLRYLEQATVVVFWWYPLVWMARKRLRRSEERCCDALVTSKLPNLSGAYANCLLKTTEYLAAAGVKDPALAGGAAAVDELKERLTMIMKKTHTRSLALWPRLALGLLAMVSLAVAPVRATTRFVGSADSEAQRVSVQYYDTDVREVLRSISNQAGLSLAFTPEVDGKVSIVFVDQPVSVALRSVLDEAGLEATQEHGILWVHPPGQTPTEVETFTGEPITLDLEDADIREVLQILSRASGTNLVVDSNVHGRGSVTLRDVPWDQALDIVVRSNGLALEIEDGVIRVFRPEPPTCADSDPGFKGKPITLKVNDAEIRDVMDVFYQLTGLQIVVVPEVQATVDVDLHEVPWDQALDLIIRSNGLQYRVENGVLTVFPAGS